ncbi:adenylyl-sulfate kinase [Aeromicrobium fastidiosum]|uniref:adenylyl-sulfate kinase n=1 Tax=Aeromicrobium fastidiosum TaxID=52699 RepID=UPI001DF11FDE|nr:adenylyl-sulfate kinase [Aeromicrobium fastidiosum]MBP2390290.1 adenylylsulfate kinase [Aeromicrobium fastidiosum]
MQEAVVWSKASPDRSAAASGRLAIEVIIMSGGIVEQESQGSTSHRFGATVWLTGLPSAGKSTLATELAGRARRDSRAVEVLDGDDVRSWLTPDLGFSREDRDANVVRVGRVAHLLARNGVLVLVPVIAPYVASREVVRELHEQAGLAFVEVHVSTSLEECQRRDAKGLYARQRSRSLSGLTGVDDPYEIPPAPALRLDTETMLDAADVLETKLRALGHL